MRVASTVRQREDRALAGQSKDLTVVLQVAKAFPVKGPVGIEESLEELRATQQTAAVVGDGEIERVSALVRAARQAQAGVLAALSPRTPRSYPRRLVSLAQPGAQEIRVAFEEP